VESIKVIVNVTIRQLEHTTSYSPFIEIMRLSCSFRDMANYLSKSRRFLLCRTCRPI